jgi:hypothetical protein
VSNTWYHAVSAAKRWGGEPEDYYAIEQFIDSSKEIIGDVRHRSMYHHTGGVFLCQRLFGTTITTQAGRRVPVRLIAEQHVEEDCGWIPSPVHWIKEMGIVPWMGGRQVRKMALADLGVETAPPAAEPACECSKIMGYPCTFNHSRPPKSEETK